LLNVVNTAGIKKGIRGDAFEFFGTAGLSAAMAGFVSELYVFLSF
jgi:hypothetical protein